MEIVVIGTEPPCVRCQTTFNRAREVARQVSGDIEVKKIAIHSKEAERYGKVEGGHTIAEVGNIKPDAEGMKRVLGELDRLTGDEKKHEKEIDAKLKELEQVLSPVKTKARELGYLMTPVLVVNGQVKSMDYVPSKEEIRGWLEIELRRQP
jgi:hypothetical protein